MVLVYELVWLTPGEHFLHLISISFYWPWFRLILLLLEGCYNICYVNEVPTFYVYYIYILYLPSSARQRYQTYADLLWTFFWLLGLLFSLYCIMYVSINLKWKTISRYYTAWPSNLSVTNIMKRIPRTCVVFASQGPEEKIDI